VSFRFSVVGYRLSQLLCLNLVIDYHRLYLSIRFGCELSVFSCGLWVVGFHSDCAWIWLLIITDFILIFVSVVGFQFSVFGCELSVVGFHCAWIWLLIITGVISIAILFVSVVRYQLSVVGFQLWVITGFISVFVSVLYSSHLPMLLV